MTILWDFVTYMHSLGASKEHLMRRVRFSFELSADWFGADQACAIADVYFDCLDGSLQ